MLNQFVIVGRLSEIIQKKKNETTISINVPRNIKDESGENEVDVLTIVSFDPVTKATIENCRAYDIVGVKGKIQSSAGSVMQLVAEKVTFLSSKND